MEEQNRRNEILFEINTHLKRIALALERIGEEGVIVKK